MTASANGAVLGEGVLNWSSGERVSDRYGAIHLAGHPWGDDFVTWETAPAGQYGTLHAVILETRPSSHIGDIARGTGPSTPAVGEQVTLGTGTLFTEMDGRVPKIGIKPDDGRDCAWMGVPALYRCHNQTVRLIFTPEGERQ